MCTTEITRQETMDREGQKLHKKTARLLTEYHVVQRKRKPNLDKDPRKITRASAAKNLSGGPRPPRGS